MLEFDVYRHRSLREALRAWIAATEGDPEAPTISELAALAGYAPSTLFNAISGERGLRGRLALGRAMGLDLEGAQVLSLLASLDAAGPDERDRLEALVCASRQRTTRAAEHGRGLMRGRWLAHAATTMATAMALPVLRHAGLQPGARALARLEARLRRIDEALARTDSQRSRQLLVEARDRSRAELVEARAAIDEAATRLTLMAEDQERGDIEALLRALSSRLMAGEEIGA